MRSASTASAAPRQRRVQAAYPGFAHFYEVTKGKATGAAQAFISWIQHSSAAKKIIETPWIPLN